MKIEKMVTPTPHPENYIKRGFFLEDFWNDRNLRLLNELKKEEYKDLDIRLRGKEIHVYYKGGKILGIKNSSLIFDSKYLKGFFEISKVNKWFENTLKENGDSKLKSSTVHNDINGYIHDMKRVMDNWFSKYHNNTEKEKQEPWERYHQQMISLAEHDNLHIIDIEFAVSFNSKCYNKEYKDTKKRLKEKDKYKPYERYPNPRFDLIGMDNSGQIHVFELKTGLNSTKNMTDHVEDFVNMIGSDEMNFQAIRFEEFNKEIASILTTYNSNKAFKKKFPVDIDIKKRPIFHFIFTEKGDEDNFDEFRKKVNYIYKKLDRIPKYHNLIKEKILDTKAIKVSKDFKIKI